MPNNTDQFIVMPEHQAHLENLDISIGLGEPIEWSVIRKAYLAQAKLTHPDKNALSNERFQQISSAYSALKSIMNNGLGAQVQEINPESAFANSVRMFSAAIEKERARVLKEMQETGLEEPAIHEIVVNGQKVTCINGSAGVKEFARRRDIEQRKANVSLAMLVALASTSSFFLFKFLRNMMKEWNKPTWDQVGTGVIIGAGLLAISSFFRPKQVQAIVPGEKSNILTKASFPNTP